MNKNSEKILEDFDKKKHLYQGLAERSSLLIRSLVNEEIRLHQIQYRIKDRKSLSNKLIRKNFKYIKLDEITDILGFRLVTYFEDDIDKIEKIFKSEFIIDEENSVDKRNVEIDKFGYRSVHYVVSIRKDRLLLTEYKDYKNLKFEIQIRSILQHSWAEIEHDIGYKGESEIPNNARRTFYRVAALLEQADIEFTKLRSEIKQYEDKIEKDISEDNFNILIDKSSIIAFIKNSKILIEVELKCNKELNIITSDDIDTKLVGGQELIKDLHNLGIETVNDLEKSLNEKSKEIIQSQKKFIEQVLARKINPGEPIKYIKGAPILWLRDYLKMNKSSHK